jgi:signal transduction histidine kinase
MPFFASGSAVQLPKSELALVTFTVSNTVLTMPIWGWDVNAMVLQHYLTAAVYLQTLWMLTLLAVKRKTFDSVAFAAGVWLLLLAGIWDLALMANHLKPDLAWAFPYSAFVVVAIAEIVLQRRYVRAMTNLETANQRMELRLAEHDAELMAQQAELLRVERERTSATERARLVHEIHAHVGQRLNGAVAALREGATDVTGAGNELQACIDDLKLMIDSLDPESHQLEALLGGLRYRFADRLKAAGIQLDWQVDDLPALSWLDAPPGTGVAARDPCIGGACHCRRWGAPSPIGCERPGVNGHCSGRARHCNDGWHDRRRNKRKQRQSIHANQVAAAPAGAYSGYPRTIRQRGWRCVKTPQPESGST